MLLPPVSISSFLVLIVVAITSAAFIRVFYNLYLHPLSKFNGPWYASTTSLVCAIISMSQKELPWLLSLIKKTGTNAPIRVSPNLLLFPQTAALKEIYWEPKLNNKGQFYASGALGPPTMFTTIDGAEHKELRKALAGPKVPWSIGGLKNMRERAATQEIVCLSDKVAEFAADIMTLFSFGMSWGFVENSRDEYGILTSWRHGLTYFAFCSRFRFYREVVLKNPVLSQWLLPKSDDQSGMGYLVKQAGRQLKQREKEIEDFGDKDAGEKDFLQHTIDARLHGQPLTEFQRLGQVTFLLMAGADTTGTALGSTLRFLSTNPQALSRAQKEIYAAEKAGLLSTPIAYEESNQHLPYLGACIKESLRLNPPAPNLFSRTTPPGGITIDGYFVPEGYEVACVSYVVQRDPELYSPDPDAFRPERWLVSKEISNQYEAASFTFGMGPRVCLGKDIAIMELWKLIPEFLRRFEIELVKEGRYVVDGGVAYNKDFLVRLRARE